MDAFNEGMILPTLIKQLRSILGRYPDDGQILKEIIQNAEDAGASKVVFLVDNSSYGTDPNKLFHKGLAQYQGPALFAYNDAIFSNDDWMGIRMLNDSVKVDDPMKVGRFGLGFKSVFHMTDLPSVFSGKGIGFIDPHTEFFEVQLPGRRAREMTTSYLWHLERDREEIARLTDQFEPFLQPLFGTSKDTLNSGNFQGTLFRFPFRTKDMRSSDLSNTTYDVNKVRDLVTSLKADAHHMLLFLRNLQSIEVYEKSSGQQPTKLLDIRIKAPYIDVVRQKCQEFKKQIRVDWTSQQSVSATYPMGISVEDRTGKNKVEEDYVWIVSQYYAGSEEGRQVTLKNSKGYLPLVGVALPVESELWKAEPKGHVFCFLPLPLEKKSPTGFRLHVHGSFAVDQNRRHIKWPSADLDMVRVKDDALVWNQFLVNVVLPKSVINLINFLTQLLSSKQNVPKEFLYKLLKANGENPEFMAGLIYAILPDDSAVTTQWKGLASTLYQTVWSQRLFCTPVSDGQWLYYSEAIFDCTEDQGTLKLLLRSIFYKDKKNLVCLPRYIYNRLPADAKKISALSACQSFKNVQYSMELKDKDRVALLQYFSAELSAPQHLLELQLLPLADGSWASFTMNSPEKLYMCSSDHPQAFLPGLERRILKVEAVPKQVIEWGSEGIFQLKWLDAKDVSQLVPGIFRVWKKQETIKVNEQPWLTVKWLTDFWTYLHKNFSQNLQSFEDIHILPLDGGVIAKLSQNAPIISKNDGYNRETRPLNADLIGLCREVGIQIIEKMESVPGLYSHPAVWNKYVFQPNASGILSALQRLEIVIGRQRLIQLFESTSEQNRKKFKEMIAVGVRTLTANDVKLLRALPLFCTVNGSGKQKSMCASLEKVKLVSPKNNDLPLPSPEVILNLSDDVSCQLANYLGVRQPSVADHLVDVYFPAICIGYLNSDELSKLMQYVCRNLTTLEQVSSRIVSHAREVSFIQKRSGDLVRPSDVYENCELLSKLFGGEDVFLSGEFAKPAYHQSLLKLGLKTSDVVTATEILEIARLLDGCGNPNPVNVKQAESMVELLNRYGDRLLTQNVYDYGLVATLKDMLMQLKWIKISDSRPSNYPPGLAFIGEKTSNLIRPSEISSHKQAHLVGSSRVTIKTQGIESVAKHFGWNAEPSLHYVIEHLRNTIQSYDPKHKPSVQYILQQVYRYVDQNQLMWDFLAILNNYSWVWHGEGFAKVDQMVMTRYQTIDLRPYVYPVPVEMAEFRKLWSHCNIKSKCNLTDVLLAIKKAHENEDELANKDRDIQLAVNILNEFAKSAINDDIRSTIIVPVNSKTKQLMMKGIDDCAYCDKEWYQHGFDEEDLDGEMHLIHELIPQVTAERLRIPSLISKTIGAEELALGYIPYGQSEPLTRRLKDILRDYTDGLAVLKELIQNADDAGATEVRFVYDERKNEEAQTILLDPGMKSLQGPALWVYNDAVFTDNDFESIVKLSGATKDTVTEKIGRFGLGFNAVYNLTDVPSFISREFIVFFDPHATYLGKAIRDKSRPGIRLNLRQKRRKIQRLVDQFKPMNGIFDCELGSNSSMESYNGTLFRFPLRTEDQAIKSEIYKKCYNRDEILQLLKLLNDSGHNLLLYTQNVTKITVYHLAESASTPSEMRQCYSIRKELEKVIRKVGNPKIKASSIQAQCAVLKQATRLLAEYRETSKKSTTVELSTSSILKFTTTRETNDEINFDHDSSSDNSFWLVVSALGRGKSFQMALRDNTLIPVGGVAIRLRKTKKGQFQVSAVDEGCGLIFCFLPLPIETSFPVHMNGYFAVHSSRTSLYESSQFDKQDKRAQWNEALLDDAVTRAYCILLEDLTQLCPGVDFYNAWPSASTLKEGPRILRRVTESLYNAVCCSSTNLRVVKAEDSWITMAESRVLNRSFRDQPIGNVALMTLQKILRDIGAYHAVDIPANIMHTILQSECRKFIEDRTIGKGEFYSNYFLPHITEIDALLRDQLILYAVQDDDIANLLEDVDCIPVTPQGIELRSIKELIHPNSQLKELYDDEEGRVPMWSSGVKIDSAILDRLVDLGMRRKTLPWVELVDRCNVVSSNPATASKRTSILVSLIDMQLKSAPQGKDSIDASLKKIQKIKFLPVLRNSNRLLLKWRGNDYQQNQLTSCEEGYLQTHKNLVSCSCPIIDEKQSFNWSCFEAKRRLGLDTPEIAPETVVQQILEVIRGGEASDDRKQISADDLTVLTEIYDAAFKWLDDFLKKTENGHSTVKKLAKYKCIMLQSDKHVNYFLAPWHCAMKFPLATDSILPYLASVPPAMIRSYPVVLKAVGVKESFSVEDYIRVLQRIAEEGGEHQLPQKQLYVAIHLVTRCIYESVKSTRLSESDGYKQLLSEMPMPNSDGVMRRADELCFNNCLWLADAAERSKFCHDLIPHTIASELGLKTIRQGVLQNHRLTGIPFGQKEKLVKRIQRILQGYPFNEDILKEMLQNADDADATEIHFIRDTRTLPDKTIFEDTWKPLQGPALCVYNNKSFKQSDLDGIQHLGEGGKFDDPTKTGQYGVGFNCVYHVTDVPTFLTTVDTHGTVLCAFDPNCTYVPGANSTDPGAMYKDVETLKRRFPDVFKGYLLNHEKYDVSETGTLFRFPLRNKENAENSEISKKAVSLEDVKKMFEQFKNDMSEALLFVNNVENLSLVEVTEGKDNKECATVVYHVDVTLTDEARASRRKFHKYVLETTKKLSSKSISLTDVTVKEVHYEMTIKDSDQNEDVWRIVQRFGFEDPFSIPEEIITAVNMGELALLPTGGVAYLKQTTRKVIRSKRVFCFLPLPVPTELPVHVNGHFVLDHESRRDLWKDEKKTHRAKWNRCLMKKVVAPAYSTLLGTARDAIKHLESYDAAKDEMEKYFKMFPKVDKDDTSYTNRLAMSVYKYIAEKNLEVLPLQNTKKDIKAVVWKNPIGVPDHKVFFDNLEEQLPEPPSQPTEFYRSSGPIRQTGNQPTKERKTAAVVRMTLVRSGFRMFSCPVRIYKWFSKAGVEVSQVNANAVLEFFATHANSPTGCKVGQLPLEISKTSFKDVPSLLDFLGYVTKAHDYKSRLDGLPFLLAVDGIVRSFDRESISYKSIYYGLAPHIPEKFIHLDVAFMLRLDGQTNSNLCADFTVEKFAEVLPVLISDAGFYDSRGCYSVESLGQFLTPYEVETSDWLAILWTFLQSLLLGTSPEHDKVIIPQLLKPLMSYCLLPVIEKESEMLYPIGLSKGVIHTTSESNVLHKELVAVLLKLGVAEPNYKYLRGTSIGLSSECTRLLQNILGNTQQPTSVVKALKIVTEKKLLDGCLDKNEGLALLRYLSSSIDALKSEPDAKEIIAKLPFFVTLNDTQTNIAGRTAYIVEWAVPSAGLEAFVQKKNIIILKSEFSQKALFDFIGCQSLSIDEVYLSLIFDNFDLFTQTDIRVHMEFVKIHIRNFFRFGKVEGVVTTRELFISRITSLRFITKPGTDEMYAPSEFYDPDNDIFKIMKETSRFPPEPYNKGDWLSLLRECGLVKHLTPEMFLSYARRIAQEAQQSINDELIAQSEMLARYLLKASQPVSKELLEDVKKIKFLVPGQEDDQLADLHDQHGERDSDHVLKFICFQDAIFHKHQKLVWTQQSLLPQWMDDQNSQEAKIRLKGLGVSFNPEQTTVAKHAEKLCLFFKSIESSDSRARKAETLKEVLMKIYEFLSEEKCLKDNVKEVLERTPCVLIEEILKLVRPNQIAFDIKSNEEIRPYLFKIPLIFGAHVILLEKLGATKDLAAQQYAMVLSDIAEGNRGAKLNPEDWLASCKAVKGLLRLIQKGEKVSGSVYLLCRDDKLHCSSEVVFIDNTSITEHSAKFDLPMLIEVLRLGYSSPHDVEIILRKLPEGQKTKFISEIVREVVLDDANVPCDFGNKMAMRLSNPSFRSGFERLVRHCLIEVNTKTTTLDQRCAELATILNRVEFVGRTKVRIHLTHNGQIIPKSERDKDFSVDLPNANGQNTAKVYIKASGILFKTEFYGTLAKAINRMTEDLLKSYLLQLAGILDPKMPIPEIHSYLNRQNIKEYGAAPTSHMTEVGIHVPQRCHHMLIQDDFVFYEDQLVALELDDPFDRGEEGAATYLLVQVIQRLEPEDPSLPIFSARYRVRINEDGEEKTVGAADLYAFSRGRRNDRNSETAIVVCERRDDTEEDNRGRQEDSASPNRDTGREEMTLSEIIETIKKILKEAWQGSEAERNKVRKRLYLKWHPDKNPDKVDLCTEVCKILQHLISLLESGKSIDDYSVSNDGKASSSGSGRTGDDFYDDFFDRMRERARNFHHQEHDYYSRRSSSRGSGGFYSSRSNFEDFFRGFTHQPNPQPEEGRRWMRQANHNLQSSMNDARNAAHPSFDWMCLKSYEAAKLAVKAVQYARDSNKLSSGLSENLINASYNLNDAELCRLCRELEQIIVSADRLRYPVGHFFPKTPSDVYDEGKANEAHRLGREIVERCSQLIEDSRSEDF